MICLKAKADKSDIPNDALRISIVDLIDRKDAVAGLFSIERKITVGSSLWHRLPACDLTSTGWKPMPLIFRTMLRENISSIGSLNRTPEKPP